MKASQYTSRWGIVNKHTALHALKEACKGAHSFAACLQMMAIFLGLGADEILSISSSVLWLLVILLVLLPGPQRLTDLHVRTNILGIQFISIHQQYLAGWPVKEVLLAPGAGRNTFGTFLGGNGTENTPDVFRHNNCEQFFEQLSRYLSSVFFIFSQKKKREAKLIYVEY